MMSVSSLDMRTTITNCLLAFLLLLPLNPTVWPQATGNQPEPQLELQIGHTEHVTSAVITSDGKYLISASDDKTAKLWELSTGILIRTFRGQGSGIRAVAANSGCDTLVTGDQAGNIVIWSLSTGERRRSFPARSQWVTFLALNSGCTRLVSAGLDNTPKLWNLSSGNEIRTFRGFARNAVAADDRQLLVGDGEGVFTLWNLANGELVRTFNGSGPAYCAAISPDGKSMAAGQVDGATIVWDIRTGKKIVTVQGPATEVFAVAISPDNRRLIAGSRNATTVWDLATGKEVAGFPSREPLRAFAVTPDSRFLAAVSFNAAVKLWNLASGEEARTFTGHAIRVGSIAMTRDGKYLVAAGADGVAKLWDLSTGQGMRTYQALRVTSIAITPDGEHLVTGSYDCTARLWNLVGGQEIRAFRGHRAGVTGVAVTPDGKYLVTAAEDHTARLWNLATGQEVRTFEANLLRPAVAVTPDGKSLIAGGLGVAKMWDIATGREEQDFGNLRAVSLAVTPDGRFLAAGRYASEAGAQLLDLATGKAVRTFKTGTYSWSVAVTPDGERVAAASDDNKAYLWDLRTGALIRAFAGHSGRLLAVAVTPDGKRVVTGSVDGSMRVWEIETGENMALVSSASNDDWIMYTPDGYFDGSKNGGDLVKMVKGLSPFGVDQFATTRNRPDIVLARLKLGDEGLLQHYRAQHERRLKRMRMPRDPVAGALRVPDAKILDSKQTGKFLRIRFRLHDARSRIKRYNIYANDVPLFGAYGKDVDGNDIIQTERIELASGRNKIEVSCMNADGAECLRALTFADYQGEVGGDLYYIGFGVSDYANKAFNLKFAHRDALDLGDAFSRMKGRSFRNVYTRTFVNGEVTVQNIKGTGKLLAKAKVDDTVVVFISGHGIHDRDAAATYYFATHGADLGNLAQTAASFELLEDIMQGIAPRKKLFLMDTCESGEADEKAANQQYAQARSRGLSPRTIENLRSRGGGGQFSPRPFLLQRDRYIYNDLLRRSGAIVFSSSQGGEFSFERDDLQNGIFTKAILSGLSSDVADKDGDGVVSTDELREYVIEEVARVSGGMQHPTVDRDNIYQKITFPLVK